MCLWSPVANQLSSGSADGTCRLWSFKELTADLWNSDKKELTLPTAILPHTVSQGEKYKDVTSISWSPDGDYLATGCYDGMIRIWTKEGKPHMTLKEHSGPVFSLKWNKVGKFILSGSYDR